MTAPCAWCNAPVEVQTPNSSPMCPECRAEIHKETNAIMSTAGRIALSRTPEEAEEHISEMQAISDRITKRYGGERDDIRELIRKGIGWASGPVQVVCFKFGVVERAAA